MLKCEMKLNEFRLFLKSTKPSFLLNKQIFLGKHFQMWGSLRINVSLIVIFAKSFFKEFHTRKRREIVS